MKEIFQNFLNRLAHLDKILVILIFFFPLLLSISIFLADLFASISALILIILLFFQDNRKIFYQIKFEIYYFLIFYFIILLTLFFSFSIKNSFLSSFFYFRYFLFAISIFYLLIKYPFFCKIIFSSIILALSLIFLDSLVQLILEKNILGYKHGFDGTKYITSFFNDEKKLGSYIVRLLPFVLSIFYYLNLNKYNQYILLCAGLLIFLSSERTALFLYLVVLLSYIFIFKKKFKTIIIFIIFFIIMIMTNEQRSFKFIEYTLQQLGISKTEWNEDHSDKIRYFSKEHEDLALTAFFIFKNNYLIGIGTKNFHGSCEFYKKKQNQENKNYLDFTQRNNELTCSTHPHNTYLQILSEIGIFGFFMIFTFFFKIVATNIKILFQKKTDHNKITYYLINLAIIINLFPFIPSGNFFNNWLSLIIFYSLGFWLFINQKNKKKLQNENN